MAMLAHYNFTEDDEVGFRHLNTVMGHSIGEEEIEKLASSPRMLVL